MIILFISTAKLCHSQISFLTCLQRSPHINGALLDVAFQRLALIDGGTRPRTEILWFALISCSRVEELVQECLRNQTRTQFIRHLTINPPQLVLLILMIDVTIDVTMDGMLIFTHLTIIPDTKTCTDIRTANYMYDYDESDDDDSPYECQGRPLQL